MSGHLVATSEVVTLVLWAALARGIREVSELSHSFSLVSVEEVANTECRLVNRKHTKRLTN